MLTAIENAKELVNSPAWPRSVQDFPKGSPVNCWGFALDGLKIPTLQERTWYSDNDGVAEEVFRFLESIGLPTRWITTPDDRESDERVLLLYLFEYRYENFRTEVFERRSECHMARIELDGTVVEKADSTEEPTITSLEKIEARIRREYDLTVSPIMIAVRKPR